MRARVTGFDLHSGQAIDETASQMALLPGNGRSGPELLRQTLGERVEPLSHRAGWTATEARALALRPKVLILDEPFGALDPITREELQEELLKIWQDHKITVLMITHDIDEALFLADRVVMMTNGPAAQIGEIMTVPFARPRERSRIMEDPRFYEFRNEALDFLYHRYAHDDTE